MFARLVATVAGIAMIIYGVIAAVSPIPFGVPIIVMGVFTIAAGNPSARPLIRRMRKHWPWFDVLVRQVARRSPQRFHKTFEETDPLGADGPFAEDGKGAPGAESASSPDKAGKNP